MTTMLWDSMVGGSGGGLGVARQHVLGACYILAQWAEPGTFGNYLLQSNFPVEHACLWTMGAVGPMVPTSDAVGSAAGVED